MPNQNNTNKLELTAWQAESLRTTCFPSPMTKINATNWWQDVVGDQPESRISRLKEGLQQDEGHVNGIKLVLGVQPFRIDWLAGPADAQDRSWIATFSDALNLYLGFMSRWLRISPPIRRLAFGAILMFPVDDRKSGYELLAKYLPDIKLDPVGSTDFLYQINRSRDSRTGIPDLRINRLSKWSVARLGRTQIELSAQETVVSYFPASEAYACRLELDINTTAEYRLDLPHDKLIEIFQDLVDLGKEIAIEGDIP